ncbi:MAG: ATP-binding cassette domain-containing protein [Deltaproteobacteria bacterium]|nr:ATP-binding cassette domain-containing protein [Deltaproteobacteria bacterium]MBK8237748.1 ATP-binding cassette domain-containing protein [Deltaproteobacteria bacterium]MBK8720119.1 ATP-binding cassette domain-containing protein [Deltaproteobacteria bacterium]MBP7289078.1 ATP-binding cassette domain-containing protein [Nannocystaceae bacterium]
MATQDVTVRAAAPVVEFEDVSKAFGALHVYEHMSLQVFAGETLSIIGGSGKGKSVCLKMMIGLLQADAGKVRVLGQDVDALDAEGLRKIRRRVAYVFQGGALFDSMSVLENIGYALREHTQLGDGQIRERARECLEMVALGADLLDAMPATLSGGERKRVALARSIAIEPEVILYDEPTTGLDPVNITNIGKMIMKLQRELRVTSVVVTHDMPTARKVSDRVAMLFERRFPFTGTVEQMWHSAEAEVRDFIHGTLRRGHGRDGRTQEQPSGA